MRKLATIDSLPKLFDESRRPIYAIDAQRRIVYCNPALSSWLDLSGKRIVGRVVEYHSESSDGDKEDRDVPPLTDLCPPPRAMAGEACMGTLSCIGREGRLVHRQAEFVPLAMSAREKTTRNETKSVSYHFAVLVLLADADMSTQEVASELSSEPTADEIHRTIRRFRRAQVSRYSMQSLLGNSGAVQKIRAQVAAAAASGANTLIVGPPGSGRGDVARAIHYGGSSEARLLPVKGELLTDDLLRRRLEGSRLRSGEATQKPTLLLENLDRMSASHQSLLSMAIRQKGFSARIIATCSSHAARAAAGSESAQIEGCRSEGHVNEPPNVSAPIEPELIDAVSTITIHIPPLSDRLQDLPIIAQYFLETCNRENDKQIGSFRADALELLALYSWPGELVQLRETVAAAHRACNSHEISPADLPNILHHGLLAATRARREPERIVLDELLASIEKEAIVRALSQTQGNKSEAAALLGMTRPRLYRRLLQLGLIGEDAEEPQEERPEFIEGEPTD